MKKNYLNSFKKLKGNLNIKNIIETGFVISNKYIKAIYLIDNNYINNIYNKIAVFVPKKYIKKSVKRNLIKRLIKESFRLHKNILNKKIYNIIFIYKYYKIKKYIIINNYIKNILYLISKR